MQFEQKGFLQGFLCGVSNWVYNGTVNNYRITIYYSEINRAPFCGAEFSRKGRRGENQHESTRERDMPPREKYEERGHSDTIRTVRVIDCQLCVNGDSSRRICCIRRRILESKLSQIN